MMASLVIMTEGKVPSLTAEDVSRDSGLTRTLVTPLSSSRE